METTILIIVMIILFLSAIAGNIDLLLVMFGQPLPEKQEFLIILAVVSDIALVCLFVSRITKKVEKVAEEKKTKRINAIESKILIIKSEFTPKPLPFKAQSSKSKITFDAKYINTEVNRIVKEYKDTLKNAVNECLIIDNKLKALLSYQSTPEERLKYLSERMDVLKKLKEQSDMLHLQIDKKRIALLNDDTKAIHYIRHAFFKLKESEKCNSNSTSIRELVSDEIPSELKMFTYQYAPLVLLHHTYFYCFFGNVILVFDNKGVYVNAIDPTILRFTVEKKTEFVYKSSSHSQDSENTGCDSHIVHAGKTRTTWTYTRKDGCADLRYTYNPRIEYRTDEVMYGKVSFYLSGKLTYSFSSYQAIVAFENATTKYEKRYNNMRDTLPDFLDLLKRLDSESGITDDISNQYKTKINHKNYFCEIQ